MHDSRVIANRFLQLAREHGQTLTLMQVLKLVYIAHGWMLGLYGRALIADPVEAWKYGPAIPKLYEKLRHYGGNAITDFISQPLVAAPLGEEEEDIVSQVYDLYGQMTGFQLSEITHAPGTPWSITNARGEYSLEIPQDLIEDYYRSLDASAPERREAA